MDTTNKPMGSANMPTGKKTAAGMEDVEKTTYHGSVEKSMQPTNKRSCVAAMLLMVVLMLGGIGFGIFQAAMNAQSRGEIVSFEASIKQKDEMIRQLEEQSGLKVVEDTEDTEDATTESVATMATDYIYIGDWGIKIKIPESLRSVSYVFYGGKDTLYVSGVTCNSGQCQHYPSFMDNTLGHGTGLGALSRRRKDDQNVKQVERDGLKTLVQVGTEYVEGLIVYENDEYYYLYSRANGVMGDASEAQWEADSAVAVGDMLKQGVSAF